MSVNEDIVDLFLDGDGMVLVRDQPSALDVDELEHLLRPEPELSSADGRVLGIEQDGRDAMRNQRRGRFDDALVVHLLTHQRLLALALVEVGQILGHLLKEGHA